MENESGTFEKSIEQSAPIRSRSPLFEFITRHDTEKMTAGERFQSKINPYRKSENSLFSMVMGVGQSKKHSSHAE